MKRLISKLAIVILSVFCLLPPTQIYAQSKLQGYTIDVASLNTSLSKYLTSLNFEEQLDGTYSLYINNSYVGSKSGDPMSFNYYPNSLTTIGISISPSNETVNFSFSQRQEEIYNSAFVFTLDAEGAQSLTFYPSANSTSGTETKTVKGSGGIFDFGSFSCTLGTTSITFSVVLNANNNTATITKNGSSNTYSVSKITTTRTLYFENFVEGHPLNMNYMEKNLAKQTFANAKTIDYSDSDIDAAVQNETLTLINSTTNKTYSVPLRRTITYWNRVSGGEWGTGTYGEQGGEIQVVCEWYDAACSSIRAKYGEDGRLFAVYGATATYPTVVSYQSTKLDYPITYHNVTWKESEWSSPGGWPSSVGNYAVIQFRQKTGTQGDYGSWTPYYIDTCSSNTDCDYKTRTMYAKATGSWGSYGTETTYYIDTCSSNGDCDYKTRNEYSDYLHGISKSGYTDQCEQKWYEKNYSCGSHYVYSGTSKGLNKSGSYQDQCVEVSEQNYSCGTHNLTCRTEACGVESYKSCATSGCGCASYKSCAHSECGVSSYKSCANSACGCASYKSCANSSCGYKSCATSGCGCASYKSCANSACGKTYYRYCKNSGGSYKTVSSTSGYPSCPSGYSSYKTSAENKTCQTSACGCSYYQTCKNSACGYASCQSSSCGCSYYQSCRTSGCGVESYKTCQTSGCGCSYYQTCKNKECGVSSYKSCAHADCGTEYNTCYLWSCPTSRSEEYNSCNLWNCPQTKTTYYQYRYRTWSDYSDYIYSSCTYTETTNCKSRTEYAYRYITWSDYSSWFNTTSKKTNSELLIYQYRYNNGIESWDEKKGTSSTLGTNIYYTGESKKSTTAQYITDTFAKTSTVTIGSLAEMTAAQIAAKTEEIKQALMLYNAYNTIKSDDGYTLYQDVVDYKNSNSKIASQAQEQALDYFERKTIFIPYMYITSHNRAVSAPGEVSGYDNETLTSVTTSEITKTATQGMKLIPYDIDLTKDTKIIYYDYRDPLINYHDELPENWRGYEELIGELQHSDLTNYKIEVELSRDDLQAMKDYLKTHNYESNDCEMLREFSYIFKTTDSDLAKFLATGKGCKIEGD